MRFSWQPERHLFTLVSAYKSVLPADQSLYIGGQFHLCSSSHGIPTLICRYIILYFFLPKRPLLLMTNCKIRSLVVSQNGSNIHSSVTTSLQYPATNLYTLVVDFIYFRLLVEPALNADIYVKMTRTCELT